MDSEFSASKAMIMAVTATVAAAVGLAAYFWALSPLKKQLSGNDKSTTQEAKHEALLPPVSLPRKVTLVLDLDETLVHTTFKPLADADWVVPIDIMGTKHNVYSRKRPGLETFMREVSNLFEVVVWAGSEEKYASPLLSLIEDTVPNSVHHRLFRDACTPAAHKDVIKDIARLGRRLERVIIVDDSPESVQLHPDNAIPISKYIDSKADCQLALLLPSLSQLAAEDDVRPALAHLRRTLTAGGGELQPESKALPVG